jgi:hypothetical protein
MGMAEFSRELSKEYWRPAPSAGSLQSHVYQTQGNEAFCSICGTPYAAGARYCHLCGESRDEDLRFEHTNRFMNRLDFDVLRIQFGFSTWSLVFLFAASVFLLAMLMTGAIHNAATPAEWQAVQTWRIEWLLAAVAALLAANLFKSRR